MRHEQSKLKSDMILCNLHANVCLETQTVKLWRRPFLPSPVHAYRFGRWNQLELQCIAAQGDKAATYDEKSATPSGQKIQKGGQAGADVEDDARYNRVDMSEQHAHEARQAFLTAVSCSEARMDLAEAALQISAEDDAIASHTVVRLPVDTYHKRLVKLAEGAAQALAALPADSSAAAQVKAVEKFLWKRERFRLPIFGRSNLPEMSTVDHPGVFEDARHAYLNEVLIRRVGCTAALAVVYGEVMRQLLTSGALSYGVRVECRDLSALPTAEVLPNLTRDLATAGSSTLNLCSQDVLLEVLRFLKRSYWPFAWDSSAGLSFGGFKDAANTILKGAASAELRAIAAAAAHRLERGIWTSPGAGDLRRALAASERLATVFGNGHPRERRDAAVLLLHAGNFPQALAELQEYRHTDTAASDPLQDRNLVDQLMEYASNVVKDEDLCEPLTVASALGKLPPVVKPGRKTPLTW